MDRPAPLRSSPGRGGIEAAPADQDPDQWTDDGGNVRNPYDGWRRTSWMPDGCLVANVDPRPRPDPPMLMAAVVPDEMRDAAAAQAGVVMRCGRLWIQSGCRYVSLRLADPGPWCPAQVVVYRREARGRPLRAMHRPARRAGPPGPRSADR
jgi:hypothetical protein